MDQRIEKLAKLLVNYSVNVKTGEKVLIRADSLAAPLIKAVYKEVLRAGGHPLVRCTIPGLEEGLFKIANDEQIQYIHEPDRLTMNTYDVMISIRAADNTRNLANIDTSKMVLQRLAMGELMNVVMDRSAKGELRWTTTIFPTSAYAQDADMSLDEYENFYYGAVMPDMDDPIGYWQKISSRQDRIIAWLKGKKQVHILGKETDLHLSIEGRDFINCDCHLNVPDGEIFTGPVEDSVEGHVGFSYPAIYNGREVSGINLWFEKGKVIRATAEKNEDMLQKILDTDEGARYIGEFAIGTNSGIQQFTRQILFDEKISGSFHMAVGSGYPESGSKNRSSIHWDMICDLRDGGEIWVDDEIFYRNGKFVIIP